MDKSDHAQVRPAFLPIVTPTFLTYCTELRSKYRVPTSPFLTIPYASGDNFGTLICIAVSTSAHGISPKGVQIQEGRNVQLHSSNNF